MGSVQGQPALGSRDDAACGPMLGCEQLSVSWRFRWPLIAGGGCQGVPQAVRRHQTVSPPSCGGECSPS